MRNNELASAIAAAISELHERADVARPTPERPITPLGELVGSLNVTWQELPQLTGASAVAFLRERVGSVEASLDLANERLAGFLYATPRHGNIFVEQGDRLTRRRFSIAHELGHYLLHLRPYFARHVSDEGSAQLGVVEALPMGGEQEESAQLQGRLMLPIESASDVDDTNADAATVRQRMEDEANRFAADLLMPEDVVTALVDRYQVQMREGDLIWRIASETLVSRAAAERRLLELRLLPTETWRAGSTYSVNSRN